MSNPLGAIERELEGERASALGEAGRKLEAALAELALGETEDRLDEAAMAAWHYIILRESVRMFDHKAALEVYRVPGKVRARIGVMKKPG
ncbi:MAG TPA: DUF6665 family protein [Kofleriaceae bacterium]|nr:DUF6665 family protein [Kofleriaceae bacterium]